MGDQGSVVSADQRASHVVWTTGGLIGDITLSDNQDIAPARERKVAKTSPLDDSLMYGSLTSVAARDVMEADGPVALLNALNESGHLAGLSQVAEETLTFVHERVRTDPGFQSVLAQLDEEEGHTLVSLASHTLMRDAFGGEAE